MASPTNERPAPRIKGSWEELLQEAQRLAANHDNEAIEIYDKLITRLSKLPRAQRMANDKRLQNVLLQACVNAQAYFNVLERYDDALDVLQQMRAAVPADETEGIDIQRADILQMAGRTEEAVAILRGIAEEDDRDELQALSLVFAVYLRADEYENAAAVLEEMAQHVEQEADDAEKSADALARDRALVDYHRALLALEHHQWQAGMDLFEKAVAGNPDYAAHYQILYTGLIQGGQYQDALPFIERDRQRVIRSQFWRAVALYHMGETAQAERLWQRITETELTEQEAQNFFEVVLSFYYLDDPERMGLELVLRLLNETRNPSWSVFFLIGLGWALHNNLRNARANFDMALQQRRLAAIDTKFAPEVQLFVEDLLDAETQQKLASYFDFVQAESDSNPKDAASVDAAQSAVQGDSASASSAGERAGNESAADESATGETDAA